MLGQKQLLSPCAAASFERDQTLRLSVGGGHYGPLSDTDQTTNSVIGLRNLHDVPASRTAHDETVPGTAGQGVAE